MMPLRTPFCRNTLLACLASLIAAASGGSTFAQAVNLTCGGVLHIYEPETIDATVNPTASAVDLASNEITTPLGTYPLSRIEENKLTFDAPATRNFNLVTHGSLDRLTGKMVILWLRPEQDAKYRAGQLENMARFGEFMCSTAKRLFGNSVSHPMPDRKRLGLNSPTDLLAKLHWEIVQLGLTVNEEEEAVASYRAFNCAVTAWSISDWVWNAASADLRQRLGAESPKPEASDAECFASLLREQSRELAICQQLANGSKHFILDRHNDATVSSYRSASVSFYLSDDGKGRSVPTYGVFIEDRDRTYSDLGLFSRARDYWHDFFKRYGFG